MAKINLKKYLPELPLTLTRKDIKKYFGSLISPKYLANLDSLGKGPLRATGSKKAVYPTDAFIDWLEARIN